MKSYAHYAFCMLSRVQNVKSIGKEQRTSVVACMHARRFSEGSIIIVIGNKSMRLRTTLSFV